jgi:hypothetical protein
MGVLRADSHAAHVAPPVSLPGLWAGLDRRQLTELTLPGATIGLLGGVIAGVLAAVGGLSPALTLVAALALALPLAIAGGGYELLLARGRVPLGPLAPVALYWAVAFPLARVIHAALVTVLSGERVAVPHGWLDFVVYNMLLSVGFSIGFWWLHQSFAPRWWFHLRDRNPVAGFFINQQLQFVGRQHEEREQRRRDRRRARAQGGARRGP